MSQDYQQQLDQILAKHERWLAGTGGIRVYFTAMHLGAVGVSFRNANLRDAHLSGADLQGAVGILTVGPCDGWILYAIQHDDGPRIHAGSHWFTVAEARAHWSGSEHGEKMIAGVDALLTLAQAHGWPMPR